MRLVVIALLMVMVSRAPAEALTSQLARSRHALTAPCRTRNDGCRSQRRNDHEAVKNAARHLLTSRKTRSASIRKVRRQESRRAQSQDEMDLLALGTDAAEDGGDVATLLDGLDEGPESWVQSERERSPAAVRERRLEGLVQVPSHPGYEVRAPSRAWGTASTVTWLVQAFDELVRTDPTAPRVRVHDLSLQEGGPMNDHVSHQTGRDADIMYYQHGCQGPCVGREVSAAELDAARQWQLLRHWLELGQAQFIFVDYALQRPLYEAAQASGATTPQLAQWFQYPRGSGFHGGIIRHSPHHANHVHVRFQCPPGDRYSTAPSRGSEDDDENKALLELLGD
jgi:murein endopeptidase